MSATQLQQFIIVLLYGSSLVLQLFMVLANPMNVNKG